MGRCMGNGVACGGTFALVRSLCCFGERRSHNAAAFSVPRRHLQDQRRCAAAGQQQQQCNPPSHLHGEEKGKTAGWLNGVAWSELVSRSLHSPDPARGHAAHADERSGQAL